VILDRYFARRFALTILGVFAVFFLLLLFIDLIEQSRRYGDEAASFGQLLGLTLLNVPQGVYEILPLILIVSTLSLFLGLARSSEMVVTRAAGRSAIRALVAPVGVALIVGILAVALLNPIVAATTRAYEAKLDGMQGRASVLSLAADGLWLRQGSDTGQTVIRATRTNLDGTELAGVTFLTFGASGTPERRIEAATATLSGDAWMLTEAKVWPLVGTRNPEAEAVLHPTLRIGSTLTPDQIRDSFGTPSSISIWELPQFINRLQDAGFSARRHQVFLQMELAMPVFLVAMVLIGAGFTLRHQRGGKTGVMVLAAILFSFAAYFLRNFAQILGENGEIPALLAAWAPPLAAIGLSLGLLLHLEDG
jgi:lipopolysaccharide export system permease protein